MRRQVLLLRNGTEGEGGWDARQEEAGGHPNSVSLRAHRVIYSGFSAYGTGYRRP